MSHTRVITYVRCSTAEQAEDGLSIDAQLAKLNAYTALYDLDVVAEFADAGVSGKSYGGLQATLRHREGLRRALTALATGKADGLVVWRLDRLSRSVRDLDELVQGYFARDYALFSVTEQLDTRSAGGRMVLNILASVAQGERETIGERTASALALKRDRGEFCGGEAPYGWTLDDDGVHLVPHLGEQHAIKKARLWRSLGLSLRKVGESLEAEGVFPRCGKRWWPQTVKSLLGAQLVDERGQLAA